MIEKLIDASAKNRGLVFLGVALATVGALYSIRNVQLDAIPDLSDPQVILFTEWPGRSPTLIEDQVTYPIVSALVAAPRVTDVRGLSMFGMSFVYVLFEEGTDVYWARSRVQEYLSGIRSKLPPGVDPVIGPDATGIGWVFQYTLVNKHPDRNKHLDLAELRTLQDFTLRYAISQVKGVAEVASVGGYQKQYQVVVDPDRLRAYSLSLREIIDAIRASNNDVGGRVVEMSGREYVVRGRGYIQDLAGLSKIALRAVGATGTPVLLGEVARIRYGPDQRRGLLEWNGEGEAVGAIVIMRYGENALEVIDRVKAKLEELRPSLPPGVDFEIAYDRSQLIRRSIATLRSALVEEAIVVAVVILVFLLHVQSSLLPIISLPIAVALAFIPMYLLHIPSTIMSLGGIAIAIGATVDAEIVMVEAAHKALEHAPPHLGSDERARLLAQAAREVTPAIFFSLLIIAVSFLPVFALTGQAGRLFRPLAYTKTFTMLSAALLSVTFAPALRDLLLRGRIHAEHRHPISRAIIALYRPFVYVALRRPKTTVAIGLCALLSAVPIAGKLGQEFMPPLNEGDLLYMPITFPGISIEEAKRQLQRQDRILRSFPEVLSVFGKVGRAETPTDPAPLAMVETTVRLKPRSEWRRVKRERRFLFFRYAREEPITFDELTAEMQRAMQFPGWTGAWTMPIKTRVDMLTTGIRTPVGIKIFGHDVEEIERVGIALERLLARAPGTRSVLYERNLGGFYIDIFPRREAIARYGLQVADVQDIVESALGGLPISTTVEGRARFSINVRYPQDLRGDVEAIRRILVPVGRRGAAAAGGGGAMSAGGAKNAGGPEAVASADGGLTHVPLGQLAEVRVAGGPPMVRDEGGLLVGYVYVDVDASRTDLGSYVHGAKQIVGDALRTGALSLPTGYHLKWTGQYEQLEQMLVRMKVIVPTTLALVLLLLYLQFRSLAEALIVLCSVPFALVGSVWLLWLLDYNVSTAVWVGILALTGLAAQTGVVMVVYIDNAFERRRRAGLIRNLDDIIAAHTEGTVLRVRPKLMTVATMLIGLVPLLWASGSGADVMKRIAAPMVGGLLTSAFLTLEILPVVYTYWRAEQLLWEKLSARAPALLARLRYWTYGIVAAALTLLTLAAAPIYVELPARPVRGLLAAGAAAMLGTCLAYLGARRESPRDVLREVSPTP